MVHFVKTDLKLEKYFFIFLFLYTFKKIILSIIFDLYVAVSLTSNSNTSCRNSLDSLLRRKLKVTILYSNIGNSMYDIIHLFLSSIQCPIYILKGQLHRTLSQEDNSNIYYSRTLSLNECYRMCESF